MGPTGTLSASLYEGTWTSASGVDSVMSTPTNTLVAPAASLPSPLGSEVRRSTMAAYSSTAAVSESVGPMLHGAQDKTSAVTQAHFIAFIITPILSLVFVILVIVLIVGIVKLKKGDQRKSKVVGTPDKIEGKRNSL